MKREPIRRSSGTLDFDPITEAPSTTRKQIMALHRIRFRRLCACLVAALALLLSTRAAEADWPVGSLSEDCMANDCSVITHTAVDSLGNVFVAGEFTGKLRLAGTLVEDLGESAGTHLFVAKLGADGSYIWHETITGTSIKDIVALEYYEATDSAYSALNGAYIAGNFALDADGDALELNDEVFRGPVPSAPGNRIYIARLSSDVSTTGSQWRFVTVQGGSTHEDRLELQGSDILGSHYNKFVSNELYNRQDDRYTVNVTTAFPLAVDRILPETRGPHINAMKIGRNGDVYIGGSIQGWSFWQDPSDLDPDAVGVLVPTWDDEHPSTGGSTYIRAETELMGPPFDCPGQGVDYCTGDIHRWTEIFEKAEGATLGEHSPYSDFVAPFVARLNQAVTASVVTESWAYTTYYGAKIATDCTLNQYEDFVFRFAGLLDESCAPAEATITRIALSPGSTSDGDVVHAIGVVETVGNAVSSFTPNGDLGHPNWLTADANAASRVLSASKRHEHYWPDHTDNWFTDPADANKGATIEFGLPDEWIWGPDGPRYVIAAPPSSNPTNGGLSVAGAMEGQQWYVSIDSQGRPREHVTLTDLNPVRRLEVSKSSAFMLTEPGMSAQATITQRRLSDINMRTGDDYDFPTGVEASDLAISSSTTLGTQVYAVGTIDPSLAGGNVEFTGDDAGKFAYRSDGPDGPVGAYVLKLVETSGEKALEWVLYSRGESEDDAVEGRSVAIGAGGSSLVAAGRFKGTAIFDPLAPETNLTGFDDAWSGWAARIADVVGLWQFESDWVIGAPQPLPSAVDLTLPPDIDGVPLESVNDIIYIDDDTEQYFLLAPVCLTIRWRLSSDVGDTSRFTQQGCAGFPEDSDLQLHMAGAPADLLPGDGFDDAGYNNTTIHFPAGQENNDNAIVKIDKVKGVFTRTIPGYTVFLYDANVGNGRRPKVVRTLDFKSHSESASWEVGKRITDVRHDDPQGKEGYVLTAKAPVDMAGDNPSHQRDLRNGPIIPVNVENEDLQDPLYVAWYERDDRKVGWPTRSVRYDIRWPDEPYQIVLKSEQGSEGQREVSPGVYERQPLLRSENMSVMSAYNQPDAELPGYNPNDEHALFAPSAAGTGLTAFFALRADPPGNPEPHSLLKFLANTEPGIAPAEVEASCGDRTYRARTDDDGRWSLIVDAPDLGACSITPVLDGEGALASTWAQTTAGGSAGDDATVDLGFRRRLGRLSGSVAIGDGDGEIELGETLGGLPEAAGDQGLIVTLEYLGEVAPYRVRNTQTTEVDPQTGGYGFQELRPGRYRLRFAPPSGYIGVADQDSPSASASCPGDGCSIIVVELDPSQFTSSEELILEDLDFELRPAASIAGEVVLGRRLIGSSNDDDDDGQIDGLGDGRAGSDEPGVDGAEIRVARIGGSSDTPLPAPVFTDEEGRFALSGLDIGEYELTVVPPKGYFVLSDTDSRFVPGSGQSVLDNARGVIAFDVELSDLTNDQVVDLSGLDFELVRSSAVEGLVYQDTNANGRQDTGEPGLEGVGLDLNVRYENLVQVGGEIESQTLSIDLTVSTGSDGRWHVDELPAGDVTVQVQHETTIQGGMEQSGDPDVKLAACVDTCDHRAERTVAPGRTADDLFFGYAPTDDSHAISGSVKQLYEGANGPDESPLAGAMVTLRCGSLERVSMAPVDGDGLWSFRGIADGDACRLDFPGDLPLPVGILDADAAWAPTTGTYELVGTAPSLYDAATPINGDVLGQAFELEAKLSSVSGTVVLGNGDDVVDANDGPGLNDFELQLSYAGSPTDPDDDLLFSTRTISDGSYRFDGLLDGDYELRVVVPDDHYPVADAGAGQTDTVSLALPVDTDLSQSFGVQDRVAIEGGLTLDGDSVTDGLAGVRLRIEGTDSTGTTIGRTVRARADGGYRANGLAAGTYDVTVQLDDNLTDLDLGLGGTTETTVTVTDADEAEIPVLDDLELVRTYLARGVLFLDADVNGERARHRTGDDAQVERFEEAGVSGEEVGAWISGPYSRDNAVALDETDPFGNFEIKGLPEGTYVVGRVGETDANRRQEIILDAVRPLTGDGRRGAAGIELPTDARANTDLIELSGIVFEDVDEDTSYLAEPEWRMFVYEVVEETTRYPEFRSTNVVAGNRIFPPYPVSQLPTCVPQSDTDLGRAVKLKDEEDDHTLRDYRGAVHAVHAGTASVGFYYPMLPDFSNDVAQVPEGSCIPFVPVNSVDDEGQQIVIAKDLSYTISWPLLTPVLSVGETLMKPKRGLPNIMDQPAARVLWEGPTADDADLALPPTSLVQYIDPISVRSVDTALPADLGVLDIATKDNAGRVPIGSADGIVRLPITLRMRLSYDPESRVLSFEGIRDDSGAGEALLMPNVITPRELDLLLSVSSSADWAQAVRKLYRKTRIPHIKMDELAKQEVQEALVAGQYVPEDTDWQKALDFLNGGEAQDVPLLLSARFNTDTKSDPRIVLPYQEAGVPGALTAGRATDTGYVTLVFNDDPKVSPLPVSLEVIRVGCDRGPYRGEIKIIPPDNVFDEALTLRHSGDFGGDPSGLDFRWYQAPDEGGRSPDIPRIPDDDSGRYTVDGIAPWNSFFAGSGLNEITIQGANKTTVSDNWFLAQYRGYGQACGDGPSDRQDSELAGDPAAKPGVPRAQLAEGWIKRVVKGLNPFDARTKDFHRSESATYVSMIRQAGPRYEGPIAFSGDPDAINDIGLIEAYETVLRRGRRLTIDSNDISSYGDRASNSALLLMASRIASFYTLLGNEAYSDALDPTIGFGTASGEYGTAATSIFAFQNQVDSLLEEELLLLRGRDETRAGVAARPVYNKAFWNFTTGEGEVAYQQVYNISDQNTDGFIDEKDAKISYPQGHGDAWGHYLTAIKTHYNLLRHPNFRWYPQAEAVTVAGVPIQVDFNDERQFARTAALKAKVGAEIVDLTYRQEYVSDPEAQWQGYRDTLDPERAWGLSEWARRAGQGAYLDWVMSNAILPPDDPNPDHVGIERIDRTTVSELGDVPANYEKIQRQLDEADAGLNPLGIAHGAVPFDIDPSFLEVGSGVQGLTHYEQIHERAIGALESAVKTFDHANRLNQSLRQNQDTRDDFAVNVADQERAYKNDLIAIFGRPYPEDVGPGKTYPAGYDGPDLYHYPYFDRSNVDAAQELSGGDTPRTLEVALDTGAKKLFVDETVQYFPDAEPIQFTISARPGVGLVQPDDWSERVAIGEIQQALSEYAQAEIAYDAALSDYTGFLDALKINLRSLKGAIERNRKVDDIKVGILTEKTTIDAVIKGIESAQLVQETTVTPAKALLDAGAKCAPFSVFDPFAAGRCLAVQANATVSVPQAIQEKASNFAVKGLELLKDGLTAGLELELDRIDRKSGVDGKATEIETMLLDEGSKRIALLEKDEALRLARQNYVSKVAEGQRLLDELINYRKLVSGDTQRLRYEDMAFRIFRNDALEKYRDQFDVAARYAYLTATAYDYETNLLRSDGGSGQRFLTDIVRERSLGQIVDGELLPGSRGLAGPLGRMQANFAVLKSQMGFNNPQIEENTFSLRNELLRYKPGSACSDDDLWREKLGGVPAAGQKALAVRDLWEVPEFRRFARPFAPEDLGPQPGLVIRFGTTVTSGRNFFGRPLGPRESAYDPSNYSTRIRSAGVRLQNYENLGLSATPRVYFFPAGADMLRPADGDSFDVRPWTIVDQVLPVPFPIGEADLADPGWIPRFNGLSDSFGQVRRFPSIRAYDGVAEDVTLNSRIVGRSVWNDKWVLIIPGATLLADPYHGLCEFVHGPWDDTVNPNELPDERQACAVDRRTGEGVTDVEIVLDTYAYSGAFFALDSEEPEPDAAADQEGTLLASIDTVAAEDETCDDLEMLEDAAKKLGADPTDPDDAAWIDDLMKDEVTIAPKGDGVTSGSIPEAFNILYGTVNMGDDPVATGRIEARIHGGTMVVDSYRLDDPDERLRKSRVPESANFILRVPISDLLPPLPSTVQVGESVDIYVNGKLITSLPILERGQVLRVDLDVDALPPDLELVKTALDATPVAGRSAAYRLQVSNLGQGRAENVSLSDSLPPGLRYSDLLPEILATQGLTACTTDASSFSCDLGDLWPGEVRTYDVIAEIAPDLACGSSPRNSASVVTTPSDPKMADPYPDNNLAFADIVVGCEGDLRLSAFGPPPGATRGAAEFDLTLVVDNLGPSAATGVSLSERFESSGPYDLIEIRSNLAATCQGIPWPSPAVGLPGTPWPLPDPPPTSGVVPPTGQAGLSGPLTIDCLLDGPLPSSLDPNGDPSQGRWVLTLRMRADTSQTVASSGSVGSEAEDPYPADNTATVAHEIGETVDLALAATVEGELVGAGCPPSLGRSNTEVSAGRTMIYTLTATNTGARDAEGVILRDWLPAGALPISATPGQGQCTIEGEPGAEDRVRCLLGTIPAGAAVTVDIEVRVDASLPGGLVLGDAAHVAAEQFDPNRADDRSFTNITVRSAADLAIDKMAGAAPDERIFFLYDITNNGPSDAAGVVFEDLVEAGLRFHSAEGAVCQIDPNQSSRLECRVGRIAAGEVASVQIFFDGDTEVLMPGGLDVIVIQNAVRLTSSTFDPCPDNNLDDGKLVIGSDADVYVRKYAEPAEARAGDEATYRIRFGNAGMTSAIDVQLRDVLPEGTRFLRCVSELPDTVVTCEERPEGIFLTRIEHAGNETFSSQGPVPAGFMDSILLVAQIDSGYVLDGFGDTQPGDACHAAAQGSGWGRFAHNHAEIISVADADPGAENNFSDVCTRVEAVADLRLAVSEGTGALLERSPITPDPLPAEPPVDAGAPEPSLGVSAVSASPLGLDASCSAVQPGAALSFAYSVFNDGPGDAAEVLVTDQLPAGVVHDPATIQVTVSAGQLLSVGTDGLITLLAGDDNGQPGRINAGGQVDITIDVLVSETAECGGTLDNRVTVETRAAGGQPPFGTPSFDPDVDNDVLTESVAIECARVRVVKSVSFDGQCPGAVGQVPNQPGREPTFCFEIVNEGTTWLDQIVVTDTLDTRNLGPRVIFTDTITHGADPNLPVAPGERVQRQVTVPPITDACGLATDVVEVSAMPVDGGRAPLGCFGGVGDTDTASIFVQCSGVDTRLQLPALNTEECQTLVQIQNVGSAVAQAMLVIWGEPGACPPQAAGPLKIECTGLIRPGSAWTFPNALLPAGSRSAIAYSLNATDEVLDTQGIEVPFSELACGSLFDLIVGDHDQWFRFDKTYRESDVYRGPIGHNGQQVVLDFGEHPGQPLAISVDRACPDPVAPGQLNHAAYIGISSDQEGAEDPFFGGYATYAPLVFVGRGELSSLLNIHNSGRFCSSLEVWLKGQDNCMRPILGDVLALAPGETIVFDPASVVGPDWIGSAWVRSSQPLGVVVDTLGPSHFTAYRGSPGDVFDAGFTLGSQVNYAPLIYSEYQGWDTAIQVQNLSGVTNAKIKVYFLDRSGDVITTLVDWVCPRGSQTYFLPTIAGLPGNWVGSARIESQDWWAPGTNPIDHPGIQSVVLLDKWSDPARTARRESVAYNALTEQVAYDWQVGSSTGGVRSGSAVLAVPLLAKGNRGINSELAITNLVPKPGFTDFAIFLYDQNGLLDFVCQKLGDRQVEYIDLATWGYVPPNFLGSAVISATFWEHEVFDPAGGFARNVVGLGATVVERIGATQGQPDVPGDESKAFEAIPIFTPFHVPAAPRCPGQP